MYIFHKFVSCIQLETLEINHFYNLEVYECYDLFAIQLDLKDF